mgnify:CR=1 FL=1
MDTPLARFIDDAGQRQTLLTRIYPEARLAGLPPERFQSRCYHLGRRRWFDANHAVLGQRAMAVRLWRTTSLSRMATLPVR